MDTRTLARHVSTVHQLRLQPQPRLAPLRPPVPVAARHLSALRASKGGPSGSDEDKSWEQIINDAAGLAKSVFTKLKDTATSLLPTAPSTPSSSGKPAQPPKPEAPLGPSLGNSGGLLPNLIGRAVGGLVSSALSSLSAQMEEAAREQRGTYEEAVARLQASAKLQARLGTVTVGPVMSQSSSSSSINGVVTKQITLLIPVYGSRGGGTAQVSVVEGPQQPGERSLQIAVRTSDGGIISVDDVSGPGGGGGGRGRGNVIDVEFREVKKP